MSSDNIQSTSTHDLWVESRAFQLDISRPTNTTIQLTISRPVALDVTDGAIVILTQGKPISPNEYPDDGTQYTPSLVWGSGDKIGTAQVVGFWSGIQQQPFPVGVTANGMTSWTVTVTGTDPNAIYYASVHGASNVLQYYPLGIQSYPLEAARLERDSATYSGSIPTLPSAPLAPTPGMVYFDQALNSVQYWDATRSVWIPTRSDSIISGEFNPGTPGQTYLYVSASQLRTFDGKAWAINTGANTQLRVGTGWIPLANVSTGIELPTSPQVGDMFYNYTSQRIQYWDGAAWQVPSPSTSLFNTGAAIVPAFTVPLKAEGVEVITPYVGLLFYNTSQKVLNAWNGTSWNQVNTAEEGTPTTDKTGIGNDGSYDMRVRMIKILKTQLGWPTQCVELTEEHFNTAIDNALDTYRQLSIGAYEQRYIIFNLLKDQAVYYLNSPVDRTNAVVQVMKVHRLNVLGISTGGPDNIWSQAFAQQYYNYGYGGGDLLSTYLVHMWSEEFSRVFAGDIPFLWNEARRELTLKRAIRQNERVVLEVELERTEQELFQDRWCKQFLQNWALAETKEYLGLIRSKYTSGTPGPAGTITLNGETLLAEARQDFTELKQALLDYEYQNADHGNVSFLMA